MRIVDRGRFIVHVHGDYLIRDADARCLIGDRIELEGAVKDIEAGLEVGLAVNGELFSIMSGHNERLAENSTTLPKLSSGMRVKFNYNNKKGE
jgi:hypothetical protein